MKKIFFLASALLLSAISVNARVYVQTANENDPKWNTAIIGENAKVITFTSVADLPTTGEKEIWFAAGTYTFDAAFNIAQYDAVMAGGFQGTETSLEQREMIAGGKAYDFAYETILHGLGTSRLIHNDANKYRTSFDGLTMSGFAFEGSGAIASLKGTAANVVAVRNCKCLDNKATDGGSFHLYNGCAVIENCYFEGNIATRQGGAIYSNISSQELVIRNCCFINNEAQISDNNAGGAVHFQNAGTLQVAGCWFEGNTAPNLGQGAALSNNGKNTANVVANNVFVNNVANVEGGKCVVLMEHGMFYYNTLVENEGGAALWQKAGICKNNVFWATDLEKARHSLGEGTVYTHNAGVRTWAEGADASNIVISTSNTLMVGDVEGTLYANFVNPEAKNFALAQGSALIGRGEAIEGITTDILGAARKTADMGAYAFDGTSTGVENTAAEPVDIRAALEAGEVYTLLGQRVSEVKAGNIYIVGGHTVLVR